MYTLEGERWDLPRWLTQEVTTMAERLVLVGQDARIPVRAFHFVA